MKRISALVAAMALFFSVHSASAQAPYDWTLSSSATDPFATTGVLPPGPSTLTLYLWLACTETEGWAAAEMRIENQIADLTIFAFTPLNGVLSAGTFPDLLLAVGGCPTGSTLAGYLTCFSPGGGTGDVCIVPSSNGNRLTVDCDVPTPGLHPIETSGFGAGAAPSCADFPLCTHVHSWGACCLPDGTCITADSYEHCLELGGVHQGYPSACNPGACCLPDGTCVEVYDYPACGVCAAMGGVYQGIFTKCASSDCDDIATDAATWGRTKASYR